MNKVYFTLRFVEDPKVITNGESSTVTFRGAVNRKYRRDNEPADYFNFVAFGKTADFIAKYFKKGEPALVVCHVQNNNFTKDDGTKVYGDKYYVDEVEFFAKMSKENEDDLPPESAVNEAPADTNKAKPNSEDAETNTNNGSLYDDF